ncbi:MAG: cellulase family glycosylhydrolase [Ardenticatenaceae bacterium]|nr:cellulase family glycosylhydrolase [Ardenticatenaceae bacterium]
MPIVLFAVVALLGCRPQPAPPAPPPTPTPPGPLAARLDNEIPAYSTVTAILADAQGWWAATYDPAGLYHSPDQGHHWQPAAGFPPQPVYTLVAATGRRFAATPNGLWRDQGAGWQRVGALPAAEVMALAADGDVLYAATDRAGLWWLHGDVAQPLSIPEKGRDAGVLSVAARGAWLIIGTSGAGGWQSRNGGATWSRLPTSGSAFISSIAIADAERATVRTLDGLWQTEDGGATWHPLPNAPDAVALLAEGTTLTVGTRHGEVLRTIDSGRSWQRVGQRLNRRRIITALTRDEQGDLLAGMQDGLWQLAGDQWERRTAGLGRTRIETLARLSDGTLLAGHRDGLYRSQDGGRTWTALTAPFAGRAVIALATDPVTPTMVYAGTDGNGLFRSQDSGQTWQPLISNSVLDEQIIPGIFPDPATAGRLIARVAYERVYESANGGLAWTPRWDGLSTVTEMFTVAYDPHHPGRIFAGAADGLLRRAPGQVKWQRVAPELDDQTVLAVLPDPDQPDRIWVGATRGLFVSDDGGAHVRPTGVQGVTVSALALSPPRRDAPVGRRRPAGPSLQGRLYVGTKFHGLLTMSDTGVEPVPPLGDRTVTALVPSADGVLIATDDGLWKVSEWELERSDLEARQAAANDNRPGSVPNLLSPFPDNHSPIPAVHLLNPSDRLFRLAAESGFRAVVVVFPWREIEPNPREFHWEQTDLWVAAAEFYGLDLIVRLDQSPRWTAPHSPAETLNPVPEKLEDFGHFAFRVANRYAGRVRGYIVWNEPNLAHEWGGQRPNPDEYTALLRTAAQTIRKADPAALILGGALATTTRADAVAMDDRRFLEGMYAAGAAPWFDVLAAHPYAFGLPPDAPVSANDGMNLRRLKALRTIMAEHGDGAKPIWATEFGWTVGLTSTGLGHPITPDEQAEYLVRGRELITREFPDVALIAVWNLAEGLASGDEKAGYNLLGPHGTPGPALSRLAAANGGPPPRPPHPHRRLCWPPTPGSTWATASCPHPGGRSTVVAIPAPAGGEVSTCARAQMKPRFSRSR